MANTDINIGISSKKGSSETNICLEDINTIMSTGEIPELFSKTEIDDIKAERRKGFDYDAMIANAKEHMQIMICVGPGSDLLKTM